MKYDVIGIENPVVDFIALTKRIPKTDELVDMQQYSWQGGGNVGTAIVALARLGARCSFAGVAGNDRLGEYCIEDYRRHGVDVSHMVIDLQGDTTFAVCITEEQTTGRSFIAKWGTGKWLSPEELDRDFINSAKYIHIGFLNPCTVQAAKWAKEAGVCVSFDAGYYYSKTEEHMHLFDVFIASEQYYRAIFNDNNYKDNCRKLQEQGPKTVIITLGARGCAGWVEDEYFEVPAFDNIEVKDTTGAGDVFHGAFIYGLNQGWDGAKTAKFSSAVSAITCTRLGGRAAIPDLKTIQRFLKDGVIDYSDIDERTGFYEKGIFNSGSRP